METEKIFTAGENGRLRAPVPFQKKVEGFGQEITDIISSKPPFFVRWGTVFFLIFVSLLTSSTWFIKYPDIIQAPAKLTAINAPKEVITKTQGNLVNLFAKEGEAVNIGQVLGYMESTASHAEVISLAAQTDTAKQLLQQNEINSLITLDAQPFTSLGELQPDYQNYQQALTEFKNYASAGFYLRKRKMLLKDLAYLQHMKYNTLQQKNLSSQDLALAQKNFKANESLNTDKVIADIDYRNEKSKLIGKKLSIPQINATLINNEAQQNEKLKEIAALDKDIADQKNTFAQALNTFSSKIEDWKKRYVLTAPVVGTVHFTTFLQEKQYVQAHQRICFINPPNSSYYAELLIPQTNFGKAEKGQLVLLKLPAYPFQEFGSVKGKLEFISDMATDSGYAAKVVLPNGLITNYNKQIQFRQGLSAQAEIITQDMRLLQRVYYNLIKQVKQ